MTVEFLFFSFKEKHIVWSTQPPYSPTYSLNFLEWNITQDEGKVPVSSLEARVKILPFEIVSVNVLFKLRDSHLNFDFTRATSND